MFGCHVSTQVWQGVTSKRALLALVCTAEWHLMQGAWLMHRLVLQFNRGVNELSILVQVAPINDTHDVRGCNVQHAMALGVSTLLDMAQKELERMLKPVVVQYLCMCSMCAKTVITNNASVHAHNQCKIPGKNG